MPFVVATTKYHLLLMVHHFTYKVAPGLPKVLLLQLIYLHDGVFFFKRNCFNIGFFATRVQDANV
jgi:hypothetical protein